MKINFKNIELLNVDSNKSILENFKLSGFTISHSCLNGRCSECKLRVISGEYYMPKNQESLTEGDLSKGYCLSCITKPKSDLTVDDVNLFEGVLPDKQIRPVKISKLDLISNEIIKVVLRFPPNNPLKYLPGQYIDLSFKDIKRSYSIVSSPTNNTIELLIKKYEDGKFSDYLFNEAKVDDLLRIEGPYGTYVFFGQTEDYILFMSTGTGIAPNICLIKHIIENNLVKPENIYMVHGQRYSSEHLYDLELLFPKINIIKATSREDRIGFSKGYVQEAVLDLGIKLNRTQVFACGNPDMIIESKEKLIENGLKESNFKSEIFISSVKL